MNFAYSKKFGANFQLKMIILMFWTKCGQKGCFSSKAKKVNGTIEFGISELALVPNFSRTDNVDFFCSNLPNILVPI